MEAAAYFRSQAGECRRLAEAEQDRNDRGALLVLARHYDREEQRARALLRAPAYGSRA